ncbi:hypothetical protein [Novosphingobium sp.]|uniref:hypothetical protein n=1 Tax=Novosphingobium sp. TaxID=1874826 RepID=UPI00286A4ABF|nr:hypothetical protein [Novosphingobium sp.]
MKRVLHTIAIASAIFAMQAAAQGGLPSWERAIAQDNSFSIETPCSGAVIEQLRKAPPELSKGLILPPQSRVMCATSELAFVAGVIEGPVGKVSIFDELLSEARADPTAEGTPSLTSINGHRAYLNRQTEGNRVVQAGVVEVSANKIVLLIAGTQSDATLSVEDQNAIIDKFYQSLRISVK